MQPAASDEASRRRLATIAALVRAGADVDTSTPRGRAEVAQCQDVQALQQLASSGVNLAGLGGKHFGRILITKGIDDAEAGRRAGVLADIAAAAAMVLEECGREGSAPQHRKMCSDGGIRYLEYLRALGLDPAGAQLAGHAIVGSAAVVRRVDALRWVLQGGADPNASAESSSSPMQRIAWAYWLDDLPERVELLLSYGTDVRLNGPGFGRHGVGPLCLAARAGNRIMVEILIKHANPEDFKCRGKTATEEASRRYLAQEPATKSRRNRDYDEVISLLQAHETSLAQRLQ
jgi:hypothetical protein